MIVANVVGTRPEFVQVAPLVRRLERGHTPVIIHTGQHYDALMSDVFFRELELPRPDENLGVGSEGQATQTARIMTRLEKVLERRKPDVVLVYGDTNSTLAGALTATKMGIPVGHVEAGMRSYNRSMPEEVNRVVVDHLADLLLCPTRSAIGNLRREGIRSGVTFVGDVMLDSMLFWKPRLKGLPDGLAVNLLPKRYSIMTLHRPVNVDDLTSLRRILRAVGETGEPVIFPVHPRTRASLQKGGLRKFPANITPVDPLGYLEFLSLLSRARRVLTDSGGVQKQAYFLGVPCITLREETEWVETVNAGWNVLVGSRPSAIRKAVREFRPHGRRPPYFGRGRASERIVQVMERGLRPRSRRSRTASEVG